MRMPWIAVEVHATPHARCQCRSPVHRALRGLPPRSPVGASSITQASTQTNTFARILDGSLTL